MFTGIIEEVGRVVSRQEGRLSVSAEGVLSDVELGASMAVNGVCLTVKEFDTITFSVDTMPETLRRTNLGLLSPGDPVNLERPLAFGGRMGGHLVQGHVDATGRIAAMTTEGEAVLVSIEAPPEVMQYVVVKGFIAVDGISLTIVTQETASFLVSIVEYTRHHTNLGRRRVGDLVNLETDIIAKYVERLSQPGNTGITPDFLQEHGFLLK